MRRWKGKVARGTLGLAITATVLLAGCAGTQTQPGALSAVRVPAAAHPDRGKSWMLPEKKDSKSILMYVGDLDTNDVFVFDYPNGKLVGTLTGFDYPYGGCVDAKGDVFISNFSGGDAVEYAHGGSTVLNTYASGGEPFGCSVDPKGDVAVTSYSPAEVVVFAGGNPSKGTTYASCAEYQWPMGYDNKGNLIGAGYGGVICGLLAGSKTVTTLSASGFTIYFPGGTMWDGKYLAMSGGTSLENGSGIYELSLSGSTLISHGEAILTDTCDGNYVDLVSPFILGKKNTPANDRQGRVVVGVNFDCSNVSLWRYPKGGDPLKTYSTKVGYPNGATVSIGQ